VERRQLGETGVTVSRIILGCGNFGGVGSMPALFGKGESEEEAFRIMDAAWAMGISTFDTADAYGGGRSETMIGSWITSRGHRPEITTKTYNPMEAGADRGLSRTRITRQLESSLDRLGLEQIAFYLAHEFDHETDLGETIATLEAVRDLGLINAYGFCNVTADQLRKVLEVGRPTVVQNSYSLLERGDEREVLQLCAEFNLAYTPFSPLAGGWLTGKYSRDASAPAGSRMAIRPEAYEHLRTERTFAALDRFVADAERRGVDAPTLALAWVLAEPRVTALIVGPRRPDQLEPALRALDLQLTQEQAGEVAALFE